MRSLLNDSLVRGSACVALLLAVACGGSSSDGGAGGSAGLGGGAGSGGSGNSGGNAGTAGIGGSSSVGGAGVGGGVNTGGSAGVASGGASSGGAAGAGTGGAGGSTEECVEQMGSGGFTQPDCSDLDRLRVRNPSLDPAEGVISGTSGTFRVDLEDVSGFGFNYYPGVDFESDTPGVTVNDEQFFAVLACTSNVASTTVQVDPSVPAGTEVTLTAKVMMLNETCTDTDSLSYKFTVQLAP